MNRDLDDYDNIAFLPGITEQREDGLWYAAIHAVDEELWLGRVSIAGNSQDDAEALRDRLLEAYKQPHKAEFFQWESKVCPGSWTNCADPGEAVQLKAQGFNIRGCYLRNN